MRLVSHHTLTVRLIPPPVAAAPKDLGVEQGAQVAHVPLEGHALAHATGTGTPTGELAGDTTSPLKGDDAGR